MTVPSLQLGVPLSTTLSTGQEQLYQVNVAYGQTLQVNLTSSDQNAANELYLRYNAVPTSSTYDAIYQGPLQANQYAIIPSTEAGTYYVLVDRPIGTGANTAATIEANVLPFEITDVIPDEGGDSAYVTTTIRGPSSTRRPSSSWSGRALPSTSRSATRWSTPPPSSPSST